MTFGDALVAIRNGLRVYRPAWDQSKYLEPGSYLKLGKRQDPEAPGGERESVELVAGARSTVSSCWIDVRGGNGATDANVLADDWEIRR